MSRNMIKLLAVFVKCVLLSVSVFCVGHAVQAENIKVDYLITRRG